MHPHGGPDVTVGNGFCAKIWVAMSIALSLALSSISGLIFQKLLSKRCTSSSTYVTVKILWSFYFVSTCSGVDSVNYFDSIPHYLIGEKSIWFLEKYSTVWH